MIVNKKDTISLYYESFRFYNVNGEDYKVSKLILDKDVTDGEESYFLSDDFGLLFCKSNTWRISKVLDPEKNNSEYLKLTTILYKVLTDEEFFKGPLPKRSIKRFTRPKIE